MNKLKRNIIFINQDLDKRIDKDTLSEAVSNRLDKSLNLYTQNLISTCKYLASRNTARLMKYLAKQNRGDN